MTSKKSDRNPRVSAKPGPVTFTVPVVPTTVRRSTRPKWSPGSNPPSVTTSVIEVKEPICGQAAAMAEPDTVVVQSWLGLQAPGMQMASPVSGTGVKGEPCVGPEV